MQCEYMTDEKHKYVSQPIGRNRDWPKVMAYRHKFILCDEM